MPENSPALIDYHCHLDLYPDFEQQFRACSDNRIATLSVTTTPLAWPRNRDLAATSPMVRVALGMHPQLVGTPSQELPLFERYLPETRFVGEVGLDAGPAYFRTYPQQKAIFETIVRLCAQAGGKILSVHSLRSVGDVLKIIESHLPGTTSRVVLHWFTGGHNEARRAVEAGCYFSVNLAMLLKPGASALFEVIPRRRLLTETDGPFTKAGTRPALPQDVSATTESLARLLGLSTTEACQMLCDNLAVLEGHETDTQAT